MKLCETHCYIMKMKTVKFHDHTVTFDGGMTSQRKFHDMKTPSNFTHSPIEIFECFYSKNIATVAIFWTQGSPDGVLCNRPCPSVGPFVSL